MSLKTLAPATFTAYQELIYELSGIHYPEEKLTLLSNRIAGRVRRLCVDGFDAYLELLRATDAEAELQEFLNVITTNETYFFRCPRHWQFFRDWLAHCKAAARGNPDRRLRIWSSAASNGSEAYSIAISCREVLGPDLGGFEIEILGTDLNDEVLTQARAARYHEYALSQTEPRLRSRYFRTEGDVHVLAPEIQRMVHFEVHNLQAPVPAALHRNVPFDFVFLRNVMIYFDTPSKRRVLAHMSEVLAPGGFLLVGESESLLATPDHLTYVQPSVYHVRGDGLEVPPALARKP